MVTLDEALQAMQDDIRKRPFDIEIAATYIRSIYGLGYTHALEEPDPDPKAARLCEREAWARLPV